MRAGQKDSSQVKHVIQSIAKNVPCNPKDRGNRWWRNTPIQKTATGDASCVLAAWAEGAAADPDERQCLQQHNTSHITRPKPWQDLSRLNQVFANDRTRQYRAPFDKLSLLRK
jgi:hypothetical protein